MGQTRIDANHCENEKGYIRRYPLRLTPQYSHLLRQYRTRATDYESRALPAQLSRPLAATWTPPTLAPTPAVPHDHPDR